MIIAHPTSLAATLDAAAEAYFYHQPIPLTLRFEIATLIISCQVPTGKMAGFFIPPAAEPETQARLFSGEMLHTAFARKHIQLIESARVLKLLAIDNPSVVHSLLLAEQRLGEMCYSQFCSTGECKPLTIAYMRYLSLDHTPDSANHLKLLLTHLARHRDGKGSWRGFPFFYTLLMLTEVEDPQVIHELQYASQRCNELSEQYRSNDPISKRRQAIIARIQERS